MNLNQAEALQTLCATLLESPFCFRFEVPRILSEEHGFPQWLAEDAIGEALANGLAEEFEQNHSLFVTEDSVGRPEKALRATDKTKAFVLGKFKASTEIQPASPEGPTDLDHLRNEIPPFDFASPDWISNKRAAELLDMTIRSLATLRSNGDKMIDGNETFGLHSGHCFWRKQGNAHPWYYLPLLEKETGQLTQSQAKPPASQAKTSTRPI